jgi:hypothetical protein
MSVLSCQLKTKEATELTLTLFVLGVFADDANHAAAVNDFALIANLLDGRADLHLNPFLKRILAERKACSGAKAPLMHNL